MPDESTRDFQPPPQDETLSASGPADLPSIPEGTQIQSPEDAARAAASSAVTLSITVPGYEIEGELGRGGMGVVYRAKQIGLNRPVALKMVIAGAYLSPAIRARFLLEAESVAALEHPNIVKVYAFGEHDGHPFLAMEFLTGGNLADRVKANGVLPPLVATELVAKLATAVAHAHSRGVVHRDIKPANVLLTPEGDPRLTDFGLAKVGRSDLSVTGQVLGTPAYMAPEQAAGKVREVGTSADVYALGAVLYDLLTGRPPFKGDTLQATLQLVLTAEPERPRAVNPSIPRDLETICLKCLEKQPGKRYATAQAVADDLNRFVAGEPITARPTGSVERATKWVKRNKGPTAAVSAVALALLIGSGVAVGFGLEAKEQARRANEAAGREKGEAERANQERNVAIAARNEVAKLNDQFCTALTQAWLSSIAPEQADEVELRFRPAAPLSHSEEDTLWDLASRRGTPMNDRFLESALLTPAACRQLRSRAAFLFHAAVGLAPERHKRTGELLIARLSSQPLTISHRVDLVLACARLGSRLPGETAEQAAGLSIQLLADLAGLANNTHGGSDVIRIEFEFSQVAAALAVLVEPLDASKGAEILLGALEKYGHTPTEYQLAKGIACVSERMSTDKASKSCEQAFWLLLKKSRPY